MKNFLTLGASAIALALATSAMAQEANTVDQTADPIFNTAPVFNETEGFGNEAVIDQTGEGNQAEVDQTESTGDGFAAVTQGGAGNNFADVDQNGTGDNKARIDQSSTSRSNGFSAALEPRLPGDRDTLDRSPEPDFSQTAVISQTNDGDSEAAANEAAIRQGVVGVPGFSNEARITQNGAGNEAEIEQGGGINMEDGRMFSVVSQIGNENVAENRQGESDYSNIEQNGDRNKAFVDQEYLFGVVGRTSDVFQGGNENEAEVNQTASGAASSVLQGLTADTTGNQAFVDQAAAATSVIEQGGLGGNEARTVQSAGSSGAMAFVDQIGSDNESLIMQAADATATANQYGELGDTTIIQNGAGNTATLTQLAGSLNETSFITQNGTDGTVTVDQNGTDNLSTVLQASGVDNMATVDQSGVGATSDIFQSGNGNVANVTQTGS